MSFRVTQLLAPVPIRLHRRVLPSVLAPLAVALLMAQSVSARPDNCRLALVLALDASGSVSMADDQLQRGGLAAALLAPDVAQAFLERGPVALYAFEWAGVSSQRALLHGWELIESEEDLHRVAVAIAQMRQSGFRSRGLAGDGTAIGSALIHAAAALAAGPSCGARIVDVSGDGVNSEGIEPQVVLGTLYDGITVNALVIHEPIEDPMLSIQNGGGTPLVAWFNDTVLHGPGAFSVVADGYDDYEHAMVQKLLRELSLPLMSQAEIVDEDFGQLAVRGM